MVWPWTLGPLAVGLLGIYPRLGERVEAHPQRKTVVTRDFGVGGGPGTPPGRASDLHQALLPGEPPPTGCYCCFHFVGGETEVLRS